ncbi:MAG: DUF11 domain-containing protein [Alkalinema sp. RU_4_3]|nr:DUF11 domain-containing protein [Alkalinema sp. RU_4_3]
MKLSKTQLAFVGVGAALTLSILPIDGAPAATKLMDAGRQMASKLLQKPQVNLELSAQQAVKTPKGEMAWQAIDSKIPVQPGTTIRFNVKAANVGDKAAKSLAVTQPVPAGMEFKLNSATSTAKAQTVFSIDNGKTFVANPQIPVKQANGETVMQPAPAANYTHVRWQLDQALNAKSQQQMAYEVRVK